MTFSLNEPVAAGDAAAGRLVTRPGLVESVPVPVGFYGYRLWRPRKSGRLRLVDDCPNDPRVLDAMGQPAVPNLVVNVGRSQVASDWFKAGTPPATLYLGTKGTGTPAAGDTMASHASWADVEFYSNATRPEWVDGTESGGSIDNASSVAVFNCDAGGTVFGAFLTDNPTVLQATGLLYSAGDFAASRAVLSGDTLEVTATFTVADDGV